VFTLTLWPYWMNTFTWLG